MFFCPQNTYEAAYCTEPVFHKKRQALRSVDKMLSNVPSVLKNTSNVQESYTSPSQRKHKKRKLQESITDEHRCKNPQQNFSKQNSAIHQKAQTP